MIFWGFLGDFFGFVGEIFGFLVKFLQTAGVTFLKVTSQIYPKWSKVKIGTEGGLTPAILLLV